MIFPSRFFWGGDHVFDSKHFNLICSMSVLINFLELMVDDTLESGLLRTSDLIQCSFLLAIYDTFLT